MFRKELAFVIIFLFIGASVIKTTVSIDKEKITITTLGSRGYIQDLIDNASDGDTIYIPSGTYYENIIIDKSINLVGEDKNTTIIDGAGIEYGVNLSANWINVSGFTIQHGGENNIGVFESNNVTISDCIVVNSNLGIGFDTSSRDNNIIDCQISNNVFGISIGNHYVSSVGNNIIRNCQISNNGLMGLHIINSANNTIQNNTFIFDSIALVGSLEDCYQNIDDTNTVNGKPLYYFLNEKNLTIDGWDIGQLILVNCTGFFISHIEIYDTDGGLWLAYSSNNIITKCDFSNNMMGLGLWLSNYNIVTQTKVNNNTGFLIPGSGWPSSGISVIGSYNEIKNNDASNNYIGISILTFGSLPEFVSKGNTIKNNDISSNNISGVYIFDSSNNSIYHNNFIDNTQNAYDNGINIWYDGKKGNYWDDYKEKYPDARKICCKGIWNKPYEIPDGDNKDRYPLIRQWPHSEGRVIFGARSRGACGVGWGYGPGSNESGSTPDAYFESGRGFTVTLGTMLYYDLDGILTNIPNKDNTSKVLWPLRERTLVYIKWQHEGVKHSLGTILKPMDNTAGGFILNPKLYVIPPPSNETQIELNCFEFIGFYRNGSKFERISGFSGFYAIAEENYLWPTFPKPVIVVWFIKQLDEGELYPILVAIWCKDDAEILGQPIQKAKSFYVNFLKL